MRERERESERSEGKRHQGGIGWRNLIKLMLVKSVVKNLFESKEK